MQVPQEVEKRCNRQQVQSSGKFANGANRGEERHRFGL